MAGQTRKGRRDGPSTGLLMQMIQQNHEVAEAGHKRLRDDLTTIEQEIQRVLAKLGAQSTQLSSIDSKVTAVETTPVNVEKMAFSTKQLIAVVAAALTLAAGMWRVSSQIDALQRSNDNLQAALISASRLQDERDGANRQALDQLRAAIEMRRVEIQNLSNFIQQTSPRQER